MIVFSLRKYLRSQPIVINIPTSLAPVLTIGTSKNELKEPKSIMNNRPHNGFVKMKKIIIRPVSAKKRKCSELETSSYMYIINNITQGTEIVINNGRLYLTNVSRLSKFMFIDNKEL